MVPAKLSLEEVADRRRTILDAVTPVFAERGYEGTTVGDLEAASGLSRGGIFFHFGHKRTLYLEAIGRSFQRLHETLAETELPGGDAYEMLLGSYVAMKRVREAHPDFFLLMNQLVAHRATEPDLAALHAELDEAEFGHYVEMIAARQAAGSLNPELDAEAIARAFGGISGELAEYALDHDEAATERLAARMFEVLARGAEPRGAS
jgi:AcrR family transcriptional regulator